MTEFIKGKDLSLKIDYEDYKKFLDDDNSCKKQWFGVSIQIKDEQENEANIYLILKQVFLALLNHNSAEDLWYIRHEYVLFPWFYDTKHSFLFPRFVKFLNENKQSPKSKSIICCSNLVLIELLDEFIYYPSLLSYKNLDCINDSAGIILKIHSHKTIDIISENVSTINKYVDKIIKRKDILVKVYRS